MLSWRRIGPAAGLAVGERTKKAPAHMRQGPYVRTMRDDQAALFMGQAAIVAAACSLHGPRSPVGETQRSQ